MVTAHLAALMINAGPGSEQDVGYDQVTLPAGREQRRPHAAVHTVHIRAIEQQHLQCQVRVKMAVSVLSSSSLWSHVSPIHRIIRNMRNDLKVKGKYSSSLT